MSIPEGYLYTEDHEWLEQKGSVCRVGITDYAQAELGDIVFVELPEGGQELGKGDAFANIESVKAVSEVYAPVAGKIVAVNEDIADSPEIVNASPFEKGWLVEIEVSADIEDLMKAGDYAEFVAQVSK